MTQIVEGIEGFISQRNFNSGLSMWEKEKLSRDSRYSEWENEQSLNMISTDGDSTGRKAEFMILNELLSMGYKCEIGNSRERGDLYLDLPGYKTKFLTGVEVKSARPSTGRQYQFSGIQNISLITILMFVRPEGLECRVANTNKLCQWAGRFYSYIEKGKKSGYTIPFNAHYYHNKNLQGNDILRPFTKANVEWALCETRG